MKVQSYIKALWGYLMGFHMINILAIEKYVEVCLKRRV